MSDNEQNENGQIQAEIPVAQIAEEPARVGPWMSTHAAGHGTGIAILAPLEWTRTMVINTAEALALDPSTVTNFRSACEVLDEKNIGLAKRATVLGGKQ